TPEDLAVLTPRVAQEPEIWIDTETADWNTKSPRLSLVQLRLGDGSLHVLDVLSPEMAAAYHTTFAPRVIAAPRITKWSHYARFERRILGADFVQGLQCTFELARRVPYHRLPLRSLRLAALVHHLCGTAVDKTLQRADWGQRPLSAEQLDYAAWDEEVGPGPDPPSTLSMIEALGMGKAGLTAIDLFSGSGGVSLGLQAAGFDVLVANDVNPAASRSYRRNFLRHTFIERDIR